MKFILVEGDYVSSNEVNCVYFTFDNRLLFSYFKTVQIYPDQINTELDYTRWLLFDIYGLGPQLEADWRFFDLRSNKDCNIQWIFVNMSNLVCIHPLRSLGEIELKFRTNTVKLKMQAEDLDNVLDDLIKYYKYESVHGVRDQGMVRD